jgi:hypothetical protein
MFKPFCDICQTWHGEHEAHPGRALKPKAIEVLYREGGEWYPFTLGRSHNLVHAIKFEDGSIWDAANGWRA